MRTQRAAPRYRRPSGWPAAVLSMSALFALAVLGGCDRLMGAEQRVARAEAEFEAGKLSAAMTDVKTALEGEPDNARGRALLARLSLRLGDPEGARKELDRAIANGADPASLRDLHYAIFLAQDRYEDALLALQADEDLDPLRRRIVAATAQTALGKYDEARRSLDEALGLAPDDPELRLTQARWLWATGHIKESTAELDRLVAARPDFSRAALFQGRFAMAIGDARRAVESFSRAQETAAQQLDLPEQLAIQVGLAESKLALGDVSGAEAHVHALDSRAPTAFVTLYLKARLAYARRDFSSAAAELQRALASRPDNTAARLLLGAVLVEQGSLEQAGAELGRLVAEHPGNIEARKLLARVHLARKDVVEARRVLAETPAGLARDPGADWMSGSILLMSGQTEEGIALLEQGAAADPGNVALRLDLVRAYLLAGRRDQALEVLAALPPGEGGSARQQLTVLAEVVGKAPAEARQAIAALVKEHPRDAGLMVVGGSYLAGVGLLDAAAELFDQALAVGGPVIDARLGLASIAIQRGNLSDAEQHLQRAIEADATSEPAYLGLAGIALTRQDRAAAREWLERAIGANPAAVESRLRLAELAHADHDPVRADALIEQALAVTRARAATLNRVGQTLMRASQFDEALTRFNEAAALGVDEADVNAAIAMLALGQVDEARGRLMASMKARPDWLAPVALLSELDIRERRYDQALNRVAAFEKAGGATAAADELRGGVLFAAGRHGESADAYARAAAVRPSTALVVKQYRALLLAGRPAPDKGLRNWLEVHPKDPLPRVVLAEHIMQQGDLKGAIGQYEIVLQDSPGPAVLNNLAWLYHEIGDGRAADFARRAYEAAPDRAEVADTYGWILLEQGKVDEALKLLEVAAQGAPSHPEIRYHLAAALARAGRTNEATVSLRRLLDEKATFRSRPDAERLLQSLSPG